MLCCFGGGEGWEERLNVRFSSLSAALFPAFKVCSNVMVPENQGAQHVTLTIRLFDQPFPDLLGLQIIDLESAPKFGYSA
jgi:hypothetical protein